MKPVKQDPKIRGIRCARCGGTEWRTRNTIPKTGKVVRYKICQGCKSVKKTEED